MSYRAWLSVRALPGRRDELVTAFVTRRVIEECREAIPGFIHGELLLSEDDPDAVCVTVEWQDRQDFQAWQASPVRAAQGAELAHLVQALPVSQLLRSRHVVSGII
jgi:heme-degrading monooxygenase HmoA